MYNPRRLAVNIFEYQSSSFKVVVKIYNIGSTVLDFLSTISKEGFRTWRKLNQLKRTEVSDPDSAISVTLNSLLHPIFIRPNKYDVDSIVTTVIRQEYGSKKLPVEPQLMIDAGAYIGDTAAYFLSKFRKLRVISLEPNPLSYEVAARNLIPYGQRSILLRKGLSVNGQSMNFNGDFISYGATNQKSATRIECTSIPELLEQFSISHLDILKMDIEGTEKLIFSTNPETWLNRVGFLLIETHGQEIEDLVHSVLRKNGFSMIMHRSVLYCTREHP